MKRGGAFLSGSIAGGGLVAIADAVLTTFAPVFGSFLPIFMYLAGMLIVGLLAAARPSNRWRFVAILVAVVGGLAGANMFTMTPRWDSKFGWQSCRLIAGPWHLRSPYPVATPKCWTLAMCANESHYDMTRLMQHRGCPAP